MSLGQALTCCRAAAAVEATWEQQRLAAARNHQPPPKAGGAGRPEGADGKGSWSSKAASSGKSRGAGAGAKKGGGAAAGGGDTDGGGGGDGAAAQLPVEAVLWWADGAWAPEEEAVSAAVKGGGLGGEGRLGFAVAARALLPLLYWQVRALPRVAAPLRLCTYPYRDHGTTMDHGIGCVCVCVCVDHFLLVCSMCCSSHAHCRCAG